MKKRILILVFVLMSLILALIPTKSYAFDDIDYEFQRDLYFDDDEIEPFVQNNMRDSGVSIGHYPATYSFTNDTDYSNPSGWTVEEVSGSVNVFPFLSRHNKTMELNDTSGAGFVSATLDYLDQDFGTIELWAQSTDTTLASIIMKIYDNVVDSGVFIYFNLDTFYHFDGVTFQQIPGTSASLDDTWYHFRVDFDADGGYLGLGADQYRIYIDGIDYGVYDSAAVSSSFDTLKMQTDTGPQNYKMYIDAIGLSWEVPEGLLSFTSDTVGQEPVGWVSDNDASTSTNIVASIGGKLKVLDLFDNNIAGIANISYSFPIETSYDFSFSIRVDSVAVDDNLIINLRESGVSIVAIRVDETDIDFYTSGGWFDISNGEISINTWYTFRIIASSIVPLQAFDFYLNGVLKGATLNNNNSASNGIDMLEYSTKLETDSNFNGYIDDIAIGFLAGYSFGDNLVPQRELTDFKEVNRYEFALESPDNLRTIGSSSYGTWLESDSGGNDNVNIQADSNNVNERVVQISTNNGGDVKGLRKNNFTSTDDLIEITMDFEFTAFGGTTSYNIIVIESSDSTTITAFIFWHNGSLGWFDDISSSGIPLRDDLSTGIVYSLNVRLDYTTDTFLLRWYIDGIYDDFYINPLIVSGKNGLQDIFVRSHWVDNIATILVYNIGVYESDVSESKDFGYITYRTGGLNWNSDENNIFSVVSSGFTKFGMGSRPYNMSDGANQYSNDTSEFAQHYTNTTTIYNSGGGFFLDIALAQAIFYVLGGGFFINVSISIEGVLLVEGINEYFMEFESGGIDKSESYFLVDANNKLQFRHVADDSGLEYIQARFNIDNEDSDDTFVQFTSRRSSNAFGFLRMNYTETSQIFEITTAQSTRRIILNSNKTLNDFIVLVTDNNDNTVSGLTTGFISDISLNDIETQSVSFVTSNLIQMMIPLMIILIPTILIANTWSRELIVPLFALFSLILVITGLLPVWLFFVIIISLASFMFFKRGRL